MVTTARRQLLAQRPVVVDMVTTSTARRGFATSPGDDPPKKKWEMPFGLGKFFDIGDSDNLIKTTRDRRLIKGDFPDYIPEDVRKEMDELGLDNMRDLDELEDAQSDGYNDLGLVPPEGTGTFSSPILIPSRRACRVVGYTDPVSHAVFWFTIHNDDNTYYIKDLGLFFKMLHIPDDRVHEDDGHH